MWKKTINRKIKHHLEFEVEILKKELKLKKIKL